MLAALASSFGLGTVVGAATWLQRLTGVRPQSGRVAQRGFDTVAAEGLRLLFNTGIAYALATALLSSVPGPDLALTPARAGIAIVGWFVVLAVMSIPLVGDTVALQAHVQKATWLGAVAAVVAGLLVIAIATVVGHENASTAGALRNAGAAVGALMLGSWLGVVLASRRALPRAGRDFDSATVYRVMPAATSAAAGLERALLWCVVCSLAIALGAELASPRLFDPVCVALFALTALLVAITRAATSGVEDEWRRAAQNFDALRRWRLWAERASLRQGALVFLAAISLAAPVIHDV